MNRRQLVSIAAVLCASGLTWRLRSARSQRWLGFDQPIRAGFGFEVGQQAPDFDLPLLTGGRLKLSSLKGKPLLLNFWATWCAACRLEMPWLVEFDKTYRAHGLEIIGISLDEPGDTEAIAAFTQQRGVKYQILLASSTIAEEYGGVRFLPQSFFVDRHGTITKALTGLSEKKHLEEAIQELLGDDGNHHWARTGLGYRGAGR